MAVMEWRGHKLRLEQDTFSDLTMGQAKVIKRVTGLRLVAFQTAIQEMVDSKDVDPELMQILLWLLLAQSGVKMDVSELDDVPLSEFMEALSSVVPDEKPVELVDPTTADAPVSGAPPNGSSNGSSTATLTGDDTNTFSNSPTTAISAP